VSDVVISNLTIETRRHDWFWWGDGDPFHFNIKTRTEVHAKFDPKDDHPAGSIRNVRIRNIFARGQGSSVINGHPDNWLDNISFETIRLAVSHDPAALYDKAVHALKFDMVKNLKLRDIEVVWEKPAHDKWESAAYFDRIKGLVVDGFTGQAANSGPAIVLDRVEDAQIRNTRATIKSVRSPRLALPKAPAAESTRGNGTNPK